MSDDQYPQPPAEPTKARRTDRGFKHLPTIPGSYGGETRLYESSLATHPHIWMAVTEPVDLNEHTRCAAYARAGVTDKPCTCEFKEAHAHLTIENAAALRDQLTWLIDNHYQSGD